MILNFTIKNIGGVTFNDLTSEAPFWACGHLPGSKDILLISEEESPTRANQHISSLLEGFGATSWVEFNDEIDARGLIRPGIEEGEVV